MSRMVRFSLAALLVLLLLAGGGLWLAFRAARQVPDFYRQAIAAPVEQQAEASHAMLRQTTALVSQARRAGHWEALFTQEQINGWLAVDLIENHPQLLPPGAHDPRVAISPQGIQLGCRWDGQPVSAVLSVEVGVQLAEENRLALRFYAARAGNLKLPLAQLLDHLDQATRELEFDIHWQQVDGDPVALVTWPEPETNDATHVVIETVELREGAIYVAGRSQGSEPSPPEVVEGDRESTAAAAERSPTSAAESNSTGAAAAAATSSSAATQQNSQR